MNVLEQERVPWREIEENRQLPLSQGEFLNMFRGDFRLSFLDDDVGPTETTTVRRDIDHALFIQGVHRDKFTQITFAS